MTEQESEAMAARLTRVWGVKSFASGFSDSRWYWSAEIEPSITVAFNVLANPLGKNLLFFKCGPYATHYFNSTEPQKGIQILVSEVPEFDIPQFAAKWLPVFRRNCWLSGCPIEASAHEKAEWIQGFNREELEAWNLKM